jgi:iron complex transport system substrate-binding protein
LKFIYCAFCVLFLTACKQNIQQLTIEHPISFVEIDYSNMFGIANFDSYSQLFFLNGTDTTWSIKSTDLPPNPKMVVLSSVFAGYVELLKKQNQIIGVDNCKYYCDSLLLKRFEQQKTIEIGEEGQLNLSKLLQLRPDILICSSFSSQDQSLIKRLKKSGIKLVFCDNFKEQNPLARAEWIKLFGFLFNSQSKADSLFDGISNRYEKQISNNRAKSLKPLVLTDALYSDVWNVPGGNSYTAKLIEDANGTYVFKNKNELFSYPLSLELVLKASEKCDIWLHVNQYKTKEELFKANSRYALLNVFKQSRIFNNNKRENRFGGNDFWEIGVVRPDLVLKDLMSIFENSNISDEKLYFYTRVD